MAEHSGLDAPRVVVIGGGFGGLNVVRRLRKAHVRVSLIDRRNFHLFQPLLYQVATGGLSPGEIASPLRAVLKRQKNAHVLLAEVVSVDVKGRRVIFRDGAVSYDILVVATGAGHHYFGHPQWEALAPSLKTIEDATEIRRRIFLAFEAAERESDQRRRHIWLTFVIVGGGPTGVELAGTIGEIARDTLRHDFRVINPAEARIFLLEGLDRILPTYPAVLSAKAAAALTRLGVTVRTSTLVTGIEPGLVTVRCNELSEQIPTQTVIWAAGVEASPLGRVLGEQTGAAVDRVGRVVVQPDLTLPGHSEIFVIGDLASYNHQADKPLPGVAQVAIQQGRYVAEVIQKQLRKQPVSPFRYRDPGSMATIGRAAAVADLGRLRFNGLFAWLMWLVIHIFYLIEFDNRLLVLVQWAWNYITWNRGARLITGESRLRLPEVGKSEVGGRQ